MARVPVEKSVLTWAIERADLIPEDLEKRFPKIHEWLQGERDPTLNQLEDLASATSTSLGYFFLDEPPEKELPIPHFRTEDGPLTDPSSNMMDTIHKMEKRQEWMSNYLQQQGKDPLNVVGNSELQDNPTEVAKSLRKFVGLEDEWASPYYSWENAFRGLREIIEDAGIITVRNGIVDNNVHRPLDPKEFRGFVLVDEYAPLVFINGKDSKAAQMFTLAHELAHIIMGQSASFDLRKMQPANEPIEIICNKVAAEFLVPREEMMANWSEVESLDNPFDRLAYKFKVSSLVTARRALDLDLIDKDKFFNFYEKYQREVEESTESNDGGNFYHMQNVRVGKLFFSTVYRALENGDLTYREAYDLTDIKGKTFHNYKDEIAEEIPQKLR
jgi:Zn-dependent peptidase ImmA (M78 family)